LAQPKAIAIAAGLLGALALVPGLPKVPFFIMAAVTGFVAYQLLRRGGAGAAAARVGGSAGAAAGAGAAGAGAGAAIAGKPDEELLGPASVAAVAIEVADDLAVALGLDQGKDGALLSKVVPGVRRTIYQELGLVVPAMRVRRLRGGAPGSWRVRLAELPVADGVVPADKRLVPEGADKLEPLGLTGEPGRVPGIGRPATWIRAADEAAAVAGGLPVLDPAAVLQLAVTQVVRRHAPEFLGIQETQALLDQLEKTHPALVREVVPKLATPQLVTEVLRRLVEEGVPIRDLRAILGALADWARAEKDSVILTEYVRAALKRQLAFLYLRGGALPVWLLEPMIDDAVRGGITKTQTGSFLALEPDLARDILAAFRRGFAERAPGAGAPIVLTAMDIRRHVKKLIEIEHPDAVVLSFQELTPSINLQPVGRIGI
jgi:type III secretion protein V